MRTQGDASRKPSPAGGNILVYARVRNPENKIQIESLPGERISSTLYEVFTEDWDPGLWEETVTRMGDFVDSERDTLMFWQVVDGSLARTCIAGRFA